MALKKWLEEQLVSHNLALVELQEKLDHLRKLNSDLKTIKTKKGTIYTESCISLPA